MSREPSTFRSAAASTVPKGTWLAAAESALRVKEEWRKAGHPDLPLAVEATPDLTRDKSFFLDLVQVELRLLRQSGQQYRPADYCRRFPMLDGSLLRSVHRCVQVEDLLGDNEDLFDWLAEADWPSPGDVFDDFYLLEELGRGAVARVFLCKQASMGREVVLKVTRGAKNEAAIHGRLKHPNVLPVHYVGVEKKTGLGWICMPYVGRVTLQEAWEKAFETRAPTSAADLYALTPALQDRRRRRESYEHRILTVLAQIADGIASVHADGVLHGDLKPNNILLSEEDGAPLAIDFNLARDARRTELGLIGGTLPYMAPEQLRAAAEAGGDGKCRVTVQTEAFSFGVMMYQLLVGKLPYEVDMPGRSLPAIAEALLDAQNEFHGSSEPPLVNGRPLDKRIAKLLGFLLAPDPRERPKNFGGIRDELRRMLSFSAQLGRFARRRPRAVLSVTAASALTVGVAAALSPTVLKSHRLKQAETFIAAGRHAEAIELLEPFAADSPGSAATHRLMAESFLKTGNSGSAAKHFVEAWRVDNDPKMIAMAGYCRNLLGQHEFASQFYRKAKQCGLKSFSVENNYAASLLQAPSEAFDQEISDSIETSLLLAYSLAPRNESIRILMMRHYDLTVEKPSRNRPAYPVEIAYPPSNSASKKFCRQALLYLVGLPLSAGERSHYGIACLQRLSSIVGFDNLDEFLPAEVLKEYQKLNEYKDLASLPAATSSPEPPKYLNPADEF